MRLIGVASVVGSFLPSLVGGEKIHGEALDQLPWADLQQQLSSSSNLIIDAAPSDYVEQCAPEFVNQPQSDRSNHNLIDQPSGLCVAALYCAFESCNPLAADGDGGGGVSMAERWNTYLSPEENPSFAPTSSYSDEKLQAWLDPTNPSYSVPTKVLFPALAGDAVAAVAFAKEHDVELSVKNSGHSYSGSSMKGNTLHLNMNRYKRYASEGAGPTECDATGNAAPVSGTGGIEEDLGNQPCVLALARGKSAYLRVGGGENFDKAYRAVKAFNEAQPDGYKYHLVGGGAGTVSPMGWAFQAGLASQTHGRKFGFGADQILQIEMVLPNGQHVRFGPTSWEDASGEGYRYPKTTGVSGVCNARADEEDENLWEWKPCDSENDINFDDLWFATRGGGGGTWGVVLSVYLQLHDYEPVATVVTPVAISLSSDEIPREILIVAWEFMVDFLMQPETLGLTEDDSNRCGQANAWNLVCYGENGAKVFQTAWKNYLLSKNETLLSSGVSSLVIDSLVSAADDDALITTYNDYADVVLITEGPHEGKAKDGPPPTIASEVETTTNLLLPKKCILENRDMFVQQIFSNFSPGYFYFAFGADPSVAHDQTTSVSESHREAGVMLFSAQQEGGGFSELMDVVVEYCYDLTDENNFPPIFGCNHSGPNLAGPLKIDRTKACPADWTQDKREQDCISQQEAIYGTKTLARLEEIKKTIDPTYMFNCNKCIGNNREATATPPPNDDTSGTGCPGILKAITMPLCALLALAAFSI